MEAFQAGDYPTGAEEKELQAEAAAASAGLGDLCCDEAAAPPEAGCHRVGASSRSRGDLAE